MKYTKNFDNETLVKNKIPETKNKETDAYI